MSTPPNGAMLGLDIGGTKTRALILDADGNILADHTAPTRRGPDGVVATVTDLTRTACQQAEIPSARLSSIGVGVPGQVEPITGHIRNALNLRIVEFDLGAALANALGRSVTVENDVKAAALGAAHHLGASTTDLSFLNFGTGVAAAVVSEGRLVRGHGGVAGEIGHLSVDPQGQECHCGQRGCLETLAGGGRISARLAAHPGGPTLASLPALAEAGDPDARIEVDLICRGIATAVSVMVLTHGSAMIVLGGGVIHTAPDLVREVRAMFTRQAKRSAFVRSLDLNGRMLVLPVNVPVAAIGAALIGTGLR